MALACILSALDGWPHQVRTAFCERWLPPPMAPPPSPPPELRPTRYLAIELHFGPGVVPIESANLTTALATALQVRS